MPHIDTAATLRSTADTASLETSTKLSNGEDKQYWIYEKKFDRDFKFVVEVSEAGNGRYTINIDDADHKVLQKGEKYYAIDTIVDPRTEGGAKVGFDSIKDVAKAITTELMTKVKDTSGAVELPKEDLSDTEMKILTGSLLTGTLAAPVLIGFALGGPVGAAIGAAVDVGLVALSFFVRGRG